MDINTSRKHVLYDNMVGFFALVDALNVDDLKDLKESLAEAGLPEGDEPGASAVKGILEYLSELIKDG